MVYTLRFFFSSKCSLFHNFNVFGSCIIHSLYTGCAKIKKNNSGAKRLMMIWTKNSRLLTRECYAIKTHDLMKVLLMLIFASFEVISLNTRLFYPVIMRLTTDSSTAAYQPLTRQSVLFLMRSYYLLHHTKNKYEDRSETKFKRGTIS